MTWVVVMFNAAMLAWVIAGSAQASGTPDDCGSLDAETCNAASEVGTAIGVSIIITLWVIGAVILGILWLITRPSRTCPVCGSGVKRGRTVCKSCGHDFAAAAGGAA